MRRILGIVLVASGLVIATASGAARASSPSELPLPGPAFFPESITAAPNGALFVSSLVTGEIVRFTPGLSKAKTFVADDVNVGTAGLMVDPERNVLWACAVDLNVPPTPSELRAFDLRTGALEERYTMPDGGLCADIALARGDVYVTDTLLAVGSSVSPEPIPGAPAAEPSPCGPPTRSLLLPNRRRSSRSTASRSTDQHPLHHQLQHRRAVRGRHRAGRLRRAGEADPPTRR